MSDAATTSRPQADVMSFGEPGPTPEVPFKAAAMRYTDAGQIEAAALARCLGKTRIIQWDYGNIHRNRGLVPLKGTP